MNSLLVSIIISYLLERLLDLFSFITTRSLLERCSKIYGSSYRLLSFMFLKSSHKRIHLTANNEPYPTARWKDPEHLSFSKLRIDGRWSQIHSLSSVELSFLAYRRSLLSFIFLVFMFSESCHKILIGILVWWQQLLFLGPSDRSHVL